jgi:hypothetical protein
MPHRSLLYPENTLFRIVTMTALAMLLSVMAGPAFSQSPADSLGIDPETYDPRFEIMLGGAAAGLASPTAWSSDQYYGGAVGLTMNILYWLSVQGARELSYGSSLDDEWIDYGPHHQLHASLRPYLDSAWGGIRFDLPASWLGADRFRIHSILCSAGLFREEYAIRSREHRYYRNPYGWKDGDPAELMTKNRQDTAAEVSGYYVSIAARWRLDRILNRSEDVWFGQYGFDAGVRYKAARSSSVPWPNLEPVPSGFAGAQVFINFFTKIDLIF